MQIIFSIGLIVLGLFLIFYMVPKTKNHITEIKYMQTKKISELKDMFEQMDSIGSGDNYREFVELKGKISEDNLVDTPFSNRKVAYCESSVSQVTETKETYTDNKKKKKTRVNKHETTISSDKSSQNIKFTDGSVDEKIIIEINSSGCDLDIPKTFDRFEPKNNLSGYRFFNSFSINGYGAETLGFKMIEKVIENNQSLYVIGEAFKVGNEIHIGKPTDAKKPFIVTTKSEEDLVNSSNQKAMFSLIGGIISIVIGAAIFFIK